MIDNLELKLEGKLPITRIELLEIVSSWGRKQSFITSDRLEVSRCEFKECYPLENLDVSQINKLSYVFRYSYYNGDLSKWNTSNCVDLFYTFAYSEFNNDSLNNWDVSNVKCLNKTFYESKFNGNLNNWNVISCFNIAGMFENSEFNNDSLKNWNVSNIDFMIDMFYGSKFNGDISNWNISNCEYLKRMFANSDFDGDTNEFKKKIAFLFKFFNEIFVSLKQCGLNYVISNRFSLLESLIN